MVVLNKKAFFISVMQSIIDNHYKSRIYVQTEFVDATKINAICVYLRFCMHV